MIVVSKAMTRNFGFVSVLAIGIYTVLNLELGDTSSMLDVFLFVCKLAVGAYVLAVTARDFTSLLVTKNPGYVHVGFDYFIQCVALGLYVCYYAGTDSSISSMEFLVRGALGVMCIVHAWDCVYNEFYN